jgi:hypothetical protein
MAWTALSTALDLDGHGGWHRAEPENNIGEARLPAWEKQRQQRYRVRAL